MSNVISMFSKPSAAAVINSPVLVTAPIENAPLLSAAIDATKTQDYRGRSQDFFNIEKQPISGPYGNIEDKKAIYVNRGEGTTPRAINIVSNSYEVHQPIEIFNKFASVAESHGLVISRVLNNPKNGGLLISAKYSQQQILNEAHDINFTFYTSHCGKYKTFLSMDLLRIACENQIPTLYKNKDRFIIAEKHYKNALNIDLIDQALLNVPATVFAYEEKAQALKDFNFSIDDFIGFYIESYKVNEEAKQFDTKIRALKNVYFNGTGQREIGTNAYKAYQAITFMNTHEVKKTAMREENSLIAGGNDSLKQLERLLAVAS